MLDQIEQLVHGVRDVSNSIAHDLRTPLAELRSRLEELSLTRPPPEETFAEIDAAVADVDRVIRIFNALLRLAEIDTGMRRSGFVPVDARAGRRGGRVLSAGRGAQGHRLCACQRRGPARSRAIRCCWRRRSATSSTTRSSTPVSGGSVAVTVRGAARRCGRDQRRRRRPRNSGRARSRRSRERFYRGDASRGTPGVGLGLSLVQAVARLHGGALELADNHPGLAATICFPRKA